MRVSRKGNPTGGLSVPPLSFVLVGLEGFEIAFGK